MRRNITAIFLLSFLLGYLSPEPVRAFPQEKELIMDRILNPLPDYDPFDIPPPLPQFFPDEVDKRVRAAFIDSLTNREGALEGHVHFFMDKDAELKNERGTITGLTEHVLDLFHNTIRDRERYLAAQKKALASSPSPEQKRLIESRLRNDDLTRADELLKESSTNRWGTMFNRLLSSVDLVSILSGSYVGAAVDSTVSQLLAAGSTEMSIEERKALTLYTKHLKKYPNDPRNSEVQKQVEALEKRKKRVLVQKQIEKAQKAMGEGELTRAAFHYELAAFIDPFSREAEEGLGQLRKLIGQQESERKKELSVAMDQSPEGVNPVESRDLSGLLYALTLRDPEQIEAEAKVLEKKYRRKPLAESARDASAVALEIKGQHEEAKKILGEIANSSRAPRERRKAKLLLESPEYNLLASFYEARSQHRLQTVKYVLLGKDFLKKNLIYGTAPLIASGPAGATSVAAANVIMIGSNLFEVLTANPISYQPVIDKGVAYIRNHPQSGGATEVYRVLADAYEEVGMYDKAIAYHEMSGEATEEKIADLKEKAAKSLLQAAQKSTKRGVKEFYLKRILDKYPESPAAKEATQKLAALAKIDNQGL
ncbi:MAG: tol-pal system YbgF family protein, partial [Candidatus Binatia bacterium]